MGCSTLGFFGKCWIRYISWKAVKRHIDVHRRGGRYDDKVDMMQRISPFIQAETSRYAAKKEQLLRKKACFAWVVDEDGRRAHRLFRSFWDAITQIEKSIRQEKFGILRKREEYLKEAKRYREARDGCDDKTMRHIEVYYKMQQDSLYERFYRETMEACEAQVRLYSEKLRLIHQVNNRIEMEKAQSLRRLRYYYSCACERTTNLDGFYKPEQKIEEYNDGDNPPADYTGLLIETEQEYNKISKILDEVKVNTAEERSKPTSAETALSSASAALWMAECLGFDGAEAFKHQMRMTERSSPAAGKREPEDTTK